LCKHPFNPPTAIYLEVNIMAKSTPRTPISEEGRPFKHRSGRWARKCKGKLEVA
jgi:hypothetical protein